MKRIKKWLSRFWNALFPQPNYLTKYYVTIYKEPLVRNDFGVCEYLHTVHIGESFDDRKSAYIRLNELMGSYSLHGAIKVGELISFENGVLVEVLTWKVNGEIDILYPHTGQKKHYKDYLNYHKFEIEKWGKI